jgi:hypothetical protein
LILNLLARYTYSMLAFATALPMLIAFLGVSSATYLFLKKKDAPFGAWFALAAVLLALQIGYAFFLTYLQHEMWSGQELGRVFLTEPLDQEAPVPFWVLPIAAKLYEPGGYFLFYALGRFFEPLLLLIIESALVTGGALVLERLGRASGEDVWLLAAISVSIGHPYILLFGLGTLVLAVIIAAYGHAARRDVSVTLGIPAVLAGSIAMAAKLLAMLY